MTSVKKGKIYLAFKVAVIQMTVGKSKQQNIERAVNAIRTAKQNDACMAILPECFNCPYGTKYFSEYAEDIPNGETSKSLSECARENQMYVIGSFPETDGGRMFNSCVAWDPEGTFSGKYRKIHLFDIDIPGKITFKESDVLSAGNELTILDTPYCKIGLAICYDVRFSELASLYRKQGCSMLIYPGSFNMVTGPLHWLPLLRGRAIDNQLFVIGASPARDPMADYVSWAHSTVVDPMGEVIADAGKEDCVIYADIDLQKVTDTRLQIPIGYQKREDLYDVISVTSRL